MLSLHFEHWPKLTKSLSVPKTSLYDNLRVSTARYPDNTALHYYGNTLSYRELNNEVTALAGYLQQKLGVKTGEKVLLFMQNSPQFVIGYYAILRANAAVVPINPMLTADELSFYVRDGEIKTALAGQELYESIRPLLGSTTLENLVLAAYSEYKGNRFDGMVPTESAAERVLFTEKGHFLWREALEAGLEPTEHLAGADDLAVLPYTSGTTGLPKGCMHTNSTVRANTVGACHWSSTTSSCVHLATLPLFHVTGMVHSMHMPIYSGSTIVIMTRWNREAAVELNFRKRNGKRLTARIPPRYDG